MPAGDDTPELFPEAPPSGAARARGGAPLADRMRPVSLDEVVGQPHLVAPGAPLRVLIETGALPSLLLWGPPGTGKTTLARLLATAGPRGAAHFVALSAVSAGIKEVREVVAGAERSRRGGQRTV